MAQPPPSVSGKLRWREGKGIWKSLPGQTPSSWLPDLCSSHSILSLRPCLLSRQTCRGEAHPTRHPSQVVEGLYRTPNSLGHKETALFEHWLWKSLPQESIPPCSNAESSFLLRINCAASWAGNELFAVYCGQILKWSQSSSEGWISWCLFINTWGTLQSTTVHAETDGSRKKVHLKLHLDNFCLTGLSGTKKIKHLRFIPVLTQHTHAHPLTHHTHHRHTCQLMRDCTRLHLKLDPTNL